MNRTEKYLDRLAQAAATHRYRLLGATAEEPDVILIADYHPDGRSWFSDDIADILEAMTSEGEKIFLEGAEGKAIYRFLNMPDSPVHGIRQTLEARGIETYFNDSSTLLEKHAIIRKLRKQALADNDQETVDAALEAEKATVRERDQNMVHGPFGLSRHETRRWQVVGEAHLQQGALRQLLDEAGISYAVLAPAEHPSVEDVAKYEHALTMIGSGTVSERLTAIAELRRQPTRMARQKLEGSLEDRSGRVRRDAAYALGMMSRRDSTADAIISSLPDEDPLSEWTKYRALARLGGAEVEAMAISRLASGKRTEWIQAAALMTQGRYRSAGGYLVHGLRSDDPLIRALSTRLLDQEGTPAGLIVSRTEDRDPAVREEAVRWLAANYPVALAGTSALAEEDPEIRAFLQGRNGHGGYRLRETDRVRGSVLGAIIGDALGAPYEGCPMDHRAGAAAAPLMYRENVGRRVSLARGDHTDDGEMTLRIMASMAATGRVDPFDIARRFGEIGLSIDDDPGKNTGYGYLTLMAFRQLYAGVNWRFTGSGSTACGPAIRVAPIAALESDRLTEDLEAQARITHGTGLAAAGGVAIGYAIRSAYENITDPKAFVAEVARKTHGLSPELSAEIEMVPDMLGLDPRRVLASFPLGDPEPKRKGKGTLGTVPGAIYCFLRSRHDFTETVRTAVAYAYDADSVASMAGAISGAYNGIGGIPQDLIRELYQGDRVEREMDAFLKGATARS